MGSVDGVPALREQLSSFCPLLALSGTAADNLRGQLADLDGAGLASPWPAAFAGGTLG
jgi:hypothetical protein